MHIATNYDDLERELLSALGGQFMSSSDGMSSVQESLWSRSAAPIYNYGF